MSTCQDKELTCADCRGKFTFTAKDQEFYAEKGFSEPKRCKECRQAKEGAARRRRPGESPVTQGRDEGE